MSNKIPCGGFKLDNNFLGMNENDELSLTGGSEGEGRAYQQLVTDGTGKATWEDKKFTVTFMSDDGVNMSSDKTFSEIIDAYKAEKTISAVVHLGENDDTLFYVSAINDTLIQFFSFTRYSKVQYMQILFNNNGEIRFDQVSISAGEN